MSRWWVALYCSVLTLVDACETWLFLHNRTGTEGNPPVAWAMAHFGVIPTLLVGSAFRIAAILAIAAWAPRRFGWVLLVLIAALYTFTVVWNLA